MADAKILGIFGPGGVHCHCCGNRCNSGKHQKRAKAGKIRAARKRDKTRALQEQDDFRRSSSLPIDFNYQK